MPPSLMSTLMLTPIITTRCPSRPFYFGEKMDRQITEAPDDPQARLKFALKRNGRSPSGDIPAANGTRAHYRTGDDRRRISASGRARGRGQASRPIRTEVNSAPISYPSRMTVTRRLATPWFRLARGCFTRGPPLSRSNLDFQNAFTRRVRPKRRHGYARARIQPPDHQPR